LYYNAVGGNSPITYGPYLPFQEQTGDEIHTRYPKEGGPFQKREVSVTFSDGNGPSGYTYYNKYNKLTYNNYYDGSYRIASPMAFSFPAEQMETTLDYGPTAWDRYRPKLSTVGLGQFLAELRDAPQLMFKKLRSFRAIGNNYLAVEFGWKPFLNDLRRWYTSVKNIDRQIATLRNKNGKWLKRGGTLVDSTDQSFTSLAGGTYVSPSNFLVNQKYHRTNTTSEKIWFDGSFRFYVPGLDNPKWGRLPALSYLWDLRITPRLVYELVPYSWLVDWFSNLGSLVSNWSAINYDNLTAKYAYIMRTTTEEVSIRATYQRKYSTTFPISYSYYDGVASSNASRITKTRGAASPFGFNLSLPDLTAWQTSILAALGLSRLRV
jgi:hypothetical protein